MNKKKIFIGLIVPLIMIFFFIRNIVLVENENLDSWMGGGMRMFGKIDKMLYRVSGFTVEDNKKTYFVNLRQLPDYEDYDVSLRILPNDQRLTNTLNYINKKKWYINLDDESVTSKKSDNQNQSLGKVINIAVYRVYYDNSKKEIGLKLINKIVNH
ncbi:hypothetical protein IX49_13230 [Cellulophaga lytica]|uniref:hypothetical protein n=1 Tax=Cellulophaga lytica TaxID=979 RepID=UPI0004F636CB|nr:hypothetical protein [Cellulophaga lytica]AIM61435.1 hypothetical protein IX49_13230 [Cellulophaga lytica]MDO6853306.1 hypothetical protein [Cellulophaga lytica]